MYRPSPDSGGGGGGGVRCKAGPSRLPPFSSTPQSQCPDLAPARTAGGGAPSQSSLGSVGRYGGLLDVILRPVPSCYCVKKGIKSEGGRASSTHARKHAGFSPAPISGPPIFHRCQRVAGAGLGRGGGGVSVEGGFGWGVVGFTPWVRWGCLHYLRTCFWLLACWMLILRSQMDTDLPT